MIKTRLKPKSTLIKTFIDRRKIGLFYVIVVEC